MREATDRAPISSALPHGGGFELEFVDAEVDVAFGGIGVVLVVAGDEHIDRRHDEEREAGADDHAGDEDDADGISGGGAGAAGDDEREVTDDGGHGGHEDRTEAGAGGL